MVTWSVKICFVRGGGLATNGLFVIRFVLFIESSLTVVYVVF